jgi:hypothetical protein
MASPFDDLEPETQLLVVEFVRAEADITRVVVDALMSNEITSPRFRRKSRALIGELVDKLKAGGIPRARQLVSRAYRRGLQTGSEALNQPPSKINREAVQTIGDALEERLVEATDTVGRRVDDVFRKVGLRIAAQQITDEKTLEAAVAQTTRTLREGGVTAFVDKTGRTWGLERYAEMAIRTTTAEAINQGAYNAIVARGMDLAQVNSVEAPCPICKPFDGNVYSLTGAAEGYAVLPDLPPFHPRCRHFLVPAVGAAAERRDRLAKVAA